jgi:hypothetical protein
VSQLPIECFRVVDPHSVRLQVAVPGAAGHEYCSSSQTGKILRLSFDPPLFVAAVMKMNGKNRNFATILLQSLRNSFSKIRLNVPF